MTSKIFTKRIKKEIQMYSQTDFEFPNLYLAYDESDLCTWYFVIYDLKDTPFDGGFYMGKVMLPKEYPLKPPDFVFITPNGRFETNKKICTSFSGFHQDTYSSAWNISSMCCGLVSFMTDSQDNDESKGIGGIITTDDEKRELATNSMSFNLQNEIFVKFFSKLL